MARIHMEDECGADSCARFARARIRRRVGRNGEKTKVRPKQKNKTKFKETRETNEMKEREEGYAVWTRGMEWGVVKWPSRGEK